MFQALLAVALSPFKGSHFVVLFNVGSPSLTMTSPVLPAARRRARTHAARRPAARRDELVLCAGASYSVEPYEREASHQLSDESLEHGRLGDRSLATVPSAPGDSPTPRQPGLRRRREPYYHNSS